MNNTVLKDTTNENHLDFVGDNLACNARPRRSLVRNWSATETVPGARAVASRAMVSMMKKQTPEVLKTWWDVRLPGQIPEQGVIAEEMDGNVIKLEGQDLVAVVVGHTDTHDTTVLHVPVIGLVVAGDAAYNGVHQLLAETDPQKRREWIAALDKVESPK
jgi:hypothetical protein